MQRSRYGLPAVTAKFVSQCFGAMVLCVISGMPVTSAAQVHRHGVSEMEIAIEGRSLTIRLESPMDDLVGFERAPRTDPERAKVREVAAALRDPDKSFAFKPQAQCSVVSTTLVSDTLDPELLDGSTQPAPAAAPNAAPKSTTQASSSEHAELIANWVFACSQPEQIDSIEVKLFDAIQGIKLIDARVAGPRGQKAFKLNPKRRRVSL